MSCLLLIKVMLQISWCKNMVMMFNWACSVPLSMLSSSYCWDAANYSSIANSHYQNYASITWSRPTGKRPWWHSSGRSLLDSRRSGDSMQVSYLVLGFEQICMWSNSISRSASAVPKSPLLRGSTVVTRNVQAITILHREGKASASHS